MTTPTRRTARGQALDVQERLTLLERRLARGFGSPVWQDWAAKGGPTLNVTDYVNGWAKGVDAGMTLDATSNVQGILIGTDGVYEVTAEQRGGDVGAGDASSFLCLALAGNRGALETREGGIFSHDHTSSAYSFSTSRYIGPLLAGELITAGPPSTYATRMVYAGATVNGTIWVRRIS